ncbi:MAG: NUDIX domain-containing protein [Aggregatilineales bacterium]
MNRQISVALIRQGSAILLVRQQGSDNPEPYWALPGGTVERGETLIETLIREVREETGLSVTSVGRLIYLAQTVSANSQSTAFVFDVNEWTGTPYVENDDYVIETAFVPLHEAITRLESIPYRNMREPIVAHLRAEISAGAAWFYRVQSNGRRKMMTRLAP